jgi:hypothetical protein
MKISNELYQSLLQRYETEVQECKSTLLIYFEKSIGIADHSNILDEMDELINRMSSANDKLKMLKKTFGNEYSKL